MKHFIVIGAADGLERWRGQGVASEQTVPGDLIVMEVPQDSIAVVPTDLDAVKAMYVAKVAEAAETQRQPYITAAPGKVMEYVAKNAEALALMANPAAQTPFLTAEATAIGATVSAVAVEVRNAAMTWQAAGAKIGAAERKAKLDIVASTTPGEILAATQIDWTAVINGGS